MEGTNGKDRDSGQTTPETDAISVVELAELFGLTERRIQQLVRENVIPRSGRGRYPMRESVRRYVAYLQALQGDGDASINDALRRENLRRVRRENDEADGLLLNRDELIEIIGGIMVAFATALDQVDGQVAPDDADLRNKIREETRRARAEAVDRLCRRFGLERSTLDPSSAARTLS